MSEAGWIAIVSGVITNIGLILVALITKSNRQDVKDVKNTVAKVEKQTDGLVSALVKKEGDLGEARGEANVREKIRIENGHRKILVYVLEDNVDDLHLMERDLKRIGVVRYELFSDKEELISVIPSTVNVWIIDDNLGEGRTGVRAVIEIMKHNGNNFIILCTGAKDEKILAKYDNLGVDRTLYKDDKNYSMLFEQYVTDGLRFASLRK